MNDVRKHEIGYRLLVNKLVKEGLVFNSPFKELLDEAAEVCGITKKEAQAFAVLLTHDVNTAATSS